MSMKALTQYKIFLLAGLFLFLGATAQQIVGQAVVKPQSGSFVLPSRSNVSDKKMKVEKKPLFSVTLPHGTGKVVRVLVLCNPDKAQEALDAGADYVGLDEYIQKIKDGWTDIDIVITTPNIMPKVGALGRILGPRGLMPNPKTGTVTMDVAKAVQEVKAGKIDFKVDKYGIIAAGVAKVSFSPEQIFDNAKELIQTVIKLKPAAAKGTYVKSIYISSTMSPGVQIDVKSVAN